MIVNTTQFPYSDWLSHRSFLAAFIVLDLFTILATIKFGILLPVVLFGLLGFLLLVQNPRLGIYLTALLHIFIIQSTEELNLIEVATAFVLVLTISVWSFKTKLLNHQKFVHSQNDAWLFIFLIIASLSIIPALLNDVNIFKWAREFAPFFTLLLIFVIADQSDRKSILILIAILFAIGFYIAINNVWMYIRALQDIEYFWQITSFRKTANEPFLFAMLTISFALFIHFKALWIRFLLLLTIVLFSSALFVTFSRGYWVGALFSLMILFLLAAKPIKKRLLIQIALLFAVLWLILQLYFGNFGELIIQAVAERFTSIGESIKDASVIGRIVETQTVWNLIKHNPIVGYGLGMTYSFISPIPREMPTWYVHNGYLYIFFKLGIFGLLSFLAFYIKSIKMGFRFQKNSVDPFLRAIFLGFLAVLIGMLLVSMTSPQFIQKDSLLIIAIAIGIMNACKRKNIRSLSVPKEFHNG